MGEERSVVAAADDLVVLLNALHAAGKPLVARYPFFDVTLLAYDPRKGRVTQACDLDEFESAREARLPKTQRLADDLLAWEDVRDALVSSGAAPYANDATARDTLEGELRNASAGSNPNPTYLAFDTNVLYHRVASRGLLHRLLPTGALGAFRYVVSRAVQEELDAAIAEKYSDQDVQTLRAKVANNRLAGMLRGRAFKRGRRAKAALAEIAWLAREQRAVVAPAGATSSDKEANDRVIASSLRDFRMERVCDVVLLTSDLDMQHHAHTAGLKSLHLQLPPAGGVPLGPMDEPVLCRLLHDLAVAAGVFHLSGLDVRVWGEWPGKTPDEWRAGALRVDYPEGAPEAEAFARDLAAAERVEAAARRVAP